MGEAIVFVGRTIAVALLVIFFSPFVIVVLLLGAGMLCLGLEPPDEHKEWLLISLFIVYVAVIGVAVGRLVLS